MDRIAFFRTYLVDKPSDRFAMYSLALELKKAGQTEAAAEAFGALLDVHPASGAGHYQLGLLHEEQGDHEAARQAWEHGLAALEGIEGADARRSRSELEGALDAL